MSRKTREALSEIIDLINKWLTDGVMAHWQYSQLFDVANAALAEPLRNCEVGTAEEQAERFNDYCHKQGNRCCVGRCKESCPVFRGYKVDCAIVWAQMPYESEVK